MANIKGKIFNPETSTPMTGVSVEVYFKIEPESVLATSTTKKMEVLNSGLLKVMTR